MLNCRYSKSGQRKHSFRCYRQANQIFQNRGWDLAESHIFYTLSKQAITLKKVDEAVSALAHLLRPSNLQSAAQQASFLSEYIATQKMFLKQSNTDTLLDIGLPKVVKNSVRVLISCPSPITVPTLVAASNININVRPKLIHNPFDFPSIFFLISLNVMIIARILDESK